jgi:hypothetical protein
MTACLAWSIGKQNGLGRGAGHSPGNEKMDHSVHNSFVNVSFVKILVVRLNIGDENFYKDSGLEPGVTGGLRQDMLLFIEEG